METEGSAYSIQAKQAADGLAASHYSLLNTHISVLTVFFR